MNWVEGLKRELVARGFAVTEGHAEDIVQVVHRYFVAHELEVAEAGWVKDLQDQRDALQEDAANLRGSLISHASELGRIGSYMITRAERVDP